MPAFSSPVIVHRVQILIISASVVFLFMYPSLNHRIAELNTCTGYTLDSPDTNATSPGCGTRYFLSVDHQIECGVGEYEQHEFVSRVLLVVYGLGIPMGFVLLGWLMRGLGGEKLENETLCFLFVGYRKEFRYWEVRGGGCVRPAEDGGREGRSTSGHRPLGRTQWGGDPAAVRRLIPYPDPRTAPHSTASPPPAGTRRKDDNKANIKTCQRQVKESCTRRRDKQ